MGVVLTSLDAIKPNAKKVKDPDNRNDSGDEEFAQMEGGEEEQKVAAEEEEKPAAEEEVKKPEHPSGEWFA